MYSIKTIVSSILVFVLLFTLTSCDTANAPETFEVPEIASVTEGDFTISLHSERGLFTGSNHLYWQVSQNGEAIEVSDFSVMPVMQMADRSHSTPFSDPEATGIPGQFEQDIIFIMPSGAMGSWSAELRFTVGGSEQTMNIDLDIDPSWRLSTVRDPETDTMYVITWKDPEEPQAGSNELIFMVHKRENMMSFPPAGNLQLSIDPWMDMGGGEGHSTPFTDPAEVSEGRYEGSINYSMSGGWTTSVTLSIDGRALPEVTFGYQVQAR